MSINKEWQTKIKLELLDEFLKLPNVGDFIYSLWPDSLIFRLDENDFCTLIDHPTGPLLVLDICNPPKTLKPRYNTSVPQFADEIFDVVVLWNEQAWYANMKEFEISNEF